MSFEKMLLMTSVAVVSPNKKVQVNQEPLKHWQRFHLSPEQYFKHPSEFTVYPSPTPENIKSPHKWENERHITSTLWLLASDDG